MKVILRRDVKGLGHEGDLKEVRDGYARNFLLPSGAATLADTGALKNWERHRGEREDRAQQIRSEAHKIAVREPIKTVGEHRVTVNLHHGIEAQVVVTVVPLH